MLELVRRLLVRVLKVDRGPPEVPLGESPEMFRASRKHLTYLLVAWALKTGFIGFALLVPVIAAAIGVHAKGDAPEWVPGLLLVVFGVPYVVVSLFGYASIRLDWEMRWYILTDRSLRIREGIVFMREVTLTLANVQEIKVDQGPIQRALGIMDLLVDTAGGGAAAAAAKGSIYGHHGMMRGIDRGSDVRTKIESRVKQRRGAGLGDPDDHHDHHDHHAAPGASATHASPAGGDAFVAALRTVRDEAKRLRTALGG